MYKIFLCLLLLLCSGCITTSKCALTCNKTINLDQRPIDDRVNVGIRFEFFRDWTR
jgi:serine protease inhibitor